MHMQNAASIPLSRRSSTNDCNLYYMRLMHPVFLDTVYIQSRRGDKCSQEFASDAGWYKAFSMISKGEAFETVFLVGMLCNGDDTKKVPS